MLEDERIIRFPCEMDDQAEPFHYELIYDNNEKVVESFDMHYESKYLNDDIYHNG